MSLDDHGHQIGFWRTPSHRRKCAQAVNFTLSKAIEKGRRRRMMDSAISTAIGVLCAIGISLVVCVLVCTLCGPQAPSSVPVREYEPMQAVKGRPQ